jgi:hypothetical protein
MNNVVMPASPLAAQNCTVQDEAGIPCETCTMSGHLYLSGCIVQPKRGIPPQLTRSWSEKPGRHRGRWPTWWRRRS